MDFLTKIKTIIMKPKDFFATVKDEEGVGNAWKYYMTILGIMCIIFFLAQIPSIMFRGSIGLLAGGSMSTPSILVQLGIVLGAMLLFYILMGGLIFLIIGIMHLFYLIVGAKKGYAQTFKIIAYTSTIGLLSVPLTLLGAIPLLGFFFSVLTFPIALAIIGYALYVQVQGGIILHELTTTRAIMAVALPIILGIVLMIIGVIILIIVGVGFVNQMGAMDPISGMVTGLIN